ncbi:hypothetical protein CF327_g7606 [Tilletia walkeri]|uniref:Uncharacterized protein n=1 Tax=Tilletia walkeri TaxID=117179 RepID=A0A8X7N341_9BASI|nr:hypothetical protein CF327_g7606 [Tilletia walkeri]KAE8262213.1 hypothetical protein A4X09_0g7510 [Tilletia walkeri]
MKGPIELVSFRRSVFDLPIEYVRELIFTEGTKSPYSSDGQSCLLWGLSEEPNAFRHVRPLLTSRPGAETLSVEGPAKRSRTSFDHIDADIVAKHMNENGLLPLSARRVLSEQFEISREQLNYYIRGRVQMLLARKKKLAGISASSSGAHQG